MSMSDPPIPPADLRALFDRLDRASIAGYQCPHTFALTTACLRERGIPVEPMLRWLRVTGAGCDCEVMFNIAAP